ncbi:class I SAM-dependent methyltransferase [Rubinisphaera sp.]|uniref:class I SAM-dependent methyltransferase n=1 Tax=Rubinisphaera sp. TaxID=2024857 RepID=UPI0025CD6462|nr:class I SAM-dependent methyltransferase [Rubinisphaera sp.]
MEVAHLHELSELEQTYWWHVAKRDLVTKWLQQYAPAPGLIIEGGIGSAGNLLAFQELGYNVAGLDIMPEAVEYGRQRGLSQVQVHDLEQPWPFADETADAIVLLDVIEHVPHPVHVLQNAARALKPDGKIFLTVPAYQWLYGDWDEALGHYRRYTTRRLQQQTVAAGLKTIKVTHWNSFTLPAALGMRTWQKMCPLKRSAEFPRVSAITNQMLIGCAQIERKINQFLNVPCGLSVAGVFEKNTDSISAGNAPLPQLHREEGTEQ